MVLLPGLRFLELFRPKAPGPGSLLKERVGHGAWESHVGIAPRCCILLFGSGNLWTGSSESLSPDCSSYDSSYFSYLSPLFFFFLPLYLPFLLVIKMFLCCLAILVLKNFPSLLSWSRCLSCCSVRICELADEALTEAQLLGA